MKTVGEVRRIVIARDRGCVASVFPDAGPCYDRWGSLLSDDATPDQLEMDYIRLGARGKHHELECDHVTMCPGHHRGTGPQAGKQWATSHREELRAYLDRLYPKMTVALASDQFDRDEGGRP